MNSLLNNIIDNLIVNIKNLTIIHEDDSSHPILKFFLGLRLDEISFNSNIDTNNKTFKILLIKNLSSFLIPLEMKKIFFEFPNSSQNDLEFYHVLERLSENYVNLKNLAENSPEYIKIEKKIIKDFLIFSPFNLELDLYREQEQNKYKIDVMIDNFILDIERNQFACLLKMLKTFGKYSEFYNNCYMFRKLNYFKPVLRFIELPLNVEQNSPAYKAVTEQNKLIKKKYYKEVLRNFFTNVRKMISEKKVGIPLYINPIKLNKYKKFFQENFGNFYLDQEKFVKENPQKNIIFTEIIKYIDMEILKEWIKDIVGSIYTNQKIEESKSGFFGGVKSFFYTSAVENIIYDETKFIQKELSIEARIRIKLSCFSISEITRVNLNDVKKSSKFLIKNLDCFLNFNDEKSKMLNSNTIVKENLTNTIANLHNNLNVNNTHNSINNINEEKDKSLYINLMDSKVSQFIDQNRNKQNVPSQIIGFELYITDFNLNYTTKIAETEFLDEILIPLNKVKETDNIFVLKFLRDNNNNIDMQINLLSQAFRYNHNFIENISKFFVLEEFEKISDIINQKTSNMLNFDFVNLQRIYFENDFKNKKNEIFNFSVKINHQILIIPFSKQKSSDYSDAFIFDIGELTINNFKHHPNMRNNINDTSFSLNESGFSLDENNNNLIKYYSNNDSINSPTQSIYI